MTAISARRWATWAAASLPSIVKTVVVGLGVGMGRPSFTALRRGQCWCHIGRHPGRHWRSEPGTGVGSHLDRAARALPGAQPASGAEIHVDRVAPARAESDDGLVGADVVARVAL